MGLRQTDDDIIARGDTWKGVILELRQRMANFTVDGVRFGTILPETRSGSTNDRRLTKRSEEIVTAAFILGRLGYEGVQLFTKSQAGQELERPDLDASFKDGSVIGLEVAQVGPTRRMKHDAHIAVLEHTIRDLIERDESFAEAFGPYYLSVSASSVLGERELSSKKQGRAIVEEVMAFVRARAHYISDEVGEDRDSGYFGREYPTLHGRGATYYTSSAPYGPYFSVMDGGTVNPSPDTSELVRILDDHRRSAETYRTSRKWMLMYLSDTNELFRGTVKAAAVLRPEIAPFEAVHIADSCWNLESLT